MHPVGRLHGPYARIKIGVSANSLLVAPVERLHQIELLALGLGSQLVVAQVADHTVRVRFGMVEVRALVLGRQETRAPQVTAPRTRTEHDESRQVTVLGPEAVRDPSAERGPSRGDVARMDEIARRRVRRVERVHRTDHAQIVDNRSEVGQQFADLNSTLAVALELERRRQQSSGHALSAQVGRLRPLAGVGQQRGLRIEHVHVRRAASHEQENDLLRTRGEVRANRARGCRAKLLLEHCRQSDGSETTAQGTDELAPRRMAIIG